jgi:hypothetical protein
MSFRPLTSDRLNIALGEIEKSPRADNAALLTDVTGLQKQTSFPLFQGVARSYGRQVVVLKPKAFLRQNRSRPGTHSRLSALADSVLPREPRGEALAFRAIKARKRFPLAAPVSSLDAPSSSKPLVTPEKVSTKRLRESSGDTFLEVGGKESFRVTARSLEDQTKKLVLNLVAATEAESRAAAWGALVALGPVQKFKLERNLVEFHLIDRKAESFRFQFRSLKTDIFSEALTCEIALDKDDIDVIGYNDESFLVKILEEIRVRWNPEQVKNNWHSYKDWQSLKDKMSSDVSSSYSLKVTSLLESLFTVSGKRTGKAWIDLETLSPVAAGAAAGSKKASKYVLVTYEYRPFHFQVIKNQPEKLGLAKSTQMMTLCFWETVSDTSKEKKDLLLQLNFLINQPLIEIYSLHKGPGVTGSQALKFALDLREMTGASLLLFDDAKVQNTTGKKAARLLLWNSMSSKKMGFYESRGFRPIDIDITVPGARHQIVYISQKAHDVVRSRELLSDASFRDLSLLAKFPDQCVVKASSWLQMSSQDCCAMKVHQVVDALLSKMRSSDQGVVDRLIEDLHEMESLFNRGSMSASIRTEYATVVTTQFFLYPGSLELPGMPWTLSEVS